MAQLKWDSERNMAIKITTEVPAVEKEPENIRAPLAATDYGAMSDEELMVTAIEKGINIDGLTRQKVINALKKAV